MASTMNQIDDRQRRPRQKIVAATVVTLLAMTSWNASADEPTSAADWKDVQVPQVWKNPPSSIDSEGQGHAWFQCRVALPAAWKGRRLELYGEAADDARSYYLNETQVGQFGHFPPAFRSGLGQEQRFPAPDTAWRAGDEAVVRVRLYQSKARGNFNVAPVILFAGDQAIRLAGGWRMLIGGGDAPPPRAVGGELFSEVIEAEVAFRERRQLDGEVGPLPPGDALQSISTPTDLKAELALSDPDIGQPLQINFDQRGRMWVVEYRQYPDPAGLTMVSRDKFLRTVYDKTPPPPPHHFVGRDRITIHEDADNDGYFEQHKVFVEGLNLATSLAIGREGVFVLNPPYLLFYPDRNGDDAPDGDPEVLLEGFGLEDSHSIANSLCWGPDGWLYAAQGSTVTGNIRRFGTKDPPQHSLGQLIWRYHPETRRYEVFAEGGGNSFGVEIDASGRLYSGHNGGDTRGFHYVQGGYYQKGFGKHGELSNPYAYGYFPQMAHHSAPRFTHAFVIYQSGLLPANYQGVMFGVAPLQGQVVMSAVSPDRTSLKTNDIGLAVQTKDSWFRPVDIREGPDGAIYVADFYEQRIDHSSHYQGRVDRDSGRVYRLRAAQAERLSIPDLGSWSSLELLGLLGGGHRWRSQTALRLLADRRDPTVVEPLQRMLREESGLRALEALWALHLVGGLTRETFDAGLVHADRDVRSWTVRLACDPRSLSEGDARRMIDLANREAQPHVRSQLASSARRIPLEQGLPILDQLTRRSEDAGDIHIPLLLWWALESFASRDPEAVETWLEDADVWNRPLVRDFLLERLMRRFAESGVRSDLLHATRLLRAAPNDVARGALMRGFEQAFQGRPMAGLPDELVEQLVTSGGGSLLLRVRQGQEDALRDATALLNNRDGDADQRAAIARVFGEVGLAQFEDVLLAAATQDPSAPVRIAALTSLQAFSSEGIAAKVLHGFPQLDPEAREVALSLMASRPQWSLQLAQESWRNEDLRRSVPRHVARRLMLHPDEALRKLVASVWEDAATPDSQATGAIVGQLQEWLEEASGNPYNGKRLFGESCAKCHKLFDQGGQVGPDLTAFQRQDLARMLVNTVDPSLEIREGYETFVVHTDDGRTLTGFISDQDAQVVAIKGTDGQTLLIPRAQIEDMQAISRSIMPDGLLDKYSPQEIRDLFAYLRATQPLPE